MIEKIEILMHMNGINRKQDAIQAVEFVRDALMTKRGFFYGQGFPRSP